MKFRFLLIGFLVSFFSVESWAKDDISKIIFDKSLKEKIISDEFIEIRLGTRSIGEQIDFKREVSLKNILGGSGGFNIYIAEVKAEATREYGYSFGQNRARTNSITVDSKECKKVRVVIKHLMRKGKVVKLNGEEFDFEIIDNAKVDAYPIDCSNSTTLTKTTNKSKWITPKNSVCKGNGGKIRNGVCYATWYKAKNICSASGGELPTIAELQRVVTDCGGEVTLDASGKVADTNREKFSYQTCYKNKGFRSIDYWSSISVEYLALFIDFDGGNTKWNHKHDKDYIRCVRDGQ